MIRYHLRSEDLAQVRFALSPIFEAVASLRLLASCEPGEAFDPWLASARAVAAELELGPVADLVRAEGYVPDFLLPVPDEPITSLRAELERVRATPHDVVRSQASAVWPGEPPDGVRRLLADTGPVLSELVDQLAEYASRLIEPAWPRLLALCEADVLYRARRMALGGADALFEDLHPMLGWDGAVLTADKPHDIDLHPLIPGIVLIPCAFVNTLLLSTEETAQTMIAYAARGRAGLWSPERPAAGAALDSLLGHARASLLRLLGEPRSTGELAAALGLSAGTVSQQLGGLRRLGLAEPSRLGRRVYYRRTARGTGLLALFADEAPATGEPVGLMASGAH